MDASLRSTLLHEHEYAQLAKLTRLRSVLGGGHTLVDVVGDAHFYQPADTKAALAPLLPMAPPSSLRNRSAEDVIDELTAAEQRCAADGDAHHRPTRRRKWRAAGSTALIHFDEVPAALRSELQPQPLPRRRCRCHCRRGPWW